MKLARDEQEMLDGTRGEGLRRAMEGLVQVDGTAGIVRVTAAAAATGR
ncbi:MAG TPA: hypothetical protein VF998_09610 [Candidatus Limnocylindria bacterium]